MIDAVANDALDALEACPCCLLGPQQRCLKTPYTHLDNTEIYSDMLKECFSIQLDVASDKCGICEECVVRLRDASHFKRQVQRSQAQLHERLARALKIIEAVPPAVVKSEIADEDGESANLLVEPPVEMADGTGTSEDSADCEEADIKSEAADDDGTSDDSPGLTLSALDVRPGHPMVALRQVPRSDYRQGTHNDEACGRDRQANTSSVHRTASSPSQQPSLAHQARDIQDAPAVPSDLRGTRMVRSYVGEQQEKAACAGLPDPAAVSAGLTLSGLRCRVVVSRLTSCRSCGAPVAREASVAHTCARDTRHARGPPRPLAADHRPGAPARREPRDRDHSGPRPGNSPQSAHKHEDALTSHRTIKIHTGGKPRAIKVANSESSGGANLISKETCPPPYTSDVCKQQFMQKRKLDNKQDHIKAHAERKRVYCEVCNDEFPNKAALAKHKRIHKLYQCDECKKSFTQREGLKQHMRIHSGDKPYSCELCCKKFVTRSQYVRHKRTHTGEKPHACGYCSERFISKQSRVMHEQNHHTGDKPHRCGTCPKAFAHKSSLTVHERRHAGEKPHSCDVCYRNFTRKADLKEHQTMHTGEKIYSCELCGKRFARRYSLTVHLRIHTNDRAYSCEHCKKRFIQLSALYTHKRTHTGEKLFVCEYCNKRFSQLSALKTHKITHTGEKPYGCEICDKRFARKHHLVAHTRTHTGEKPYGCAICGNNFTLKAHIRNHLRTHSQPSNKSYSCKICRKQFAGKLALKRHKLTHAEKKCLKSDVDTTAHMSSNASV